PVHRPHCPATYNDLVFYFQYASSAYSTTGCARPNGNTLVSTINDLLTDTQGFIARDDNRKEIVVALRGSTSVQDFITDAEIVLAPFVSPGVSPPAGSLAHTGFLTAWNAVASSVISTVRAQVAAHPGYQLVSTGHSLGGALSSLAGISLQQNFGGNTVRMYTYGQPRTYNPAGAKFINTQFGSRAFRAVHTTDGVPTIIPQLDGYQHHGVEFWNFLDPSSAFTTRSCAASGEDITCSDSIPSEGIDAAHLTYFNIFASTPFCT
ncbi:alpha/beta-hydrolase, partial [Mycena latifolia]